ncbi:MAG TPA: 4'-phosphopantetheinyl transferase superfamily protein [Gemmatimonadales bacterium]|nr:4'-phosphopantetheinyl transferase superfamily protein [Gemmatimonadales bacterium]
MTALLASLFPAGVVVEAALPEDENEGLLRPEEARWLPPMVPARRREFTAGRNAARRALARLGVPAAAIDRHPGDRDPVWPDGVVGSISHAGGRVAVACALAQAFAAIGLDIEEAGPLAPEIVGTVCRPDELAALAGSAPPAPSDWPKLLFAAKESAYKAWFPVTRAPLEFRHMVLAVDAAGRRFRARVEHEAARALVAGGLALEGRFGWDPSLVAAGAVLVRR